MFRLLRVLPLLGGLSAALAAVAVQGSEDRALLEAINHYRSTPQACAGEALGELPPLVADPRLVLPEGAELQQALVVAGYPMAHAQSIRLSGPREAPAAMALLQAHYCSTLLDARFVQVGIRQTGREWRIVLARPLLTAGLADWQSEGQKLLEGINAARALPRRCGEREYPAAQPLSWNPLLGELAECHSRAMANGNFFAHVDRDGYTPSDRAELAGYGGQPVGENLAAALDTPARVLSGWLASPAHCANLMNAQFRELGAAYAIDPQSDAGIYWSALFGAP